MSPMTLHIGWPRHVRCTLQALDGPHPHATLGASRLMVAHGHAPLASLRGAPSTRLGCCPSTFSVATAAHSLMDLHPALLVLGGGGDSRHDRVHGHASPCPNIPLEWPFHTRANGRSVSWALAGCSPKTFGKACPLRSHFTLCSRVAPSRCSLPRTGRTSAAHPRPLDGRPSYYPRLPLPLDPHRRAHWAYHVTLPGPLAWHVHGHYVDMWPRFVFVESGVRTASGST